jgi:aspartate kinase
MIVMKFGGSSVESAKAIQRVAAIVREHSGLRPVVVVSAMGKTTDRLLAMARFAAAGDSQAALRELSRLRQFHLTEASGLSRAANAIRLDRDICRLFEELAQILPEVTESGSLTPRLSDAVLSFGERLSSLIVTAGFLEANIDAVHLDAHDAIVTSGRHTQAEPLFTETNALVRRRISRERVTVMGGFIGATEEGVPTTLGRGGSDYTAAIVGAALAADEIQIWTDVDGMMTCDPRLVAGAHCLRAISFDEARQMASSGAKVLHPATVQPAVRQGIPIVIRNSRNPQAAGTRIAGESPREGAVMSIACRTGVALLRLTPRGTPVTADVGREVWDAFERTGIAVELISTSEKELCVAVESASFTADLRGCLSVLAELEVEENRALVTLVGQGASRNPSNLRRASQSVRRLPGGAIPSCHANCYFSFAVAAEDLVPAAEALHDEFFARPDPAFFVPNRVNVVEGAAIAGVPPAVCRLAAQH